MVIDRRRLLSRAACVAFAPLLPGRVLAESYPTRPVRMMIGFPPGGGADVLTRITCDWLSQRLGQAFVVENRPGAATNLATEAVVRAPADGYTLLATTTSNLLNGALFEDLKYDFIRDIAPVASLSVQPLVMVVGSDGPARSVQQLIAYAKANPGKISIGHFGPGTISHLAGEYWKQQAGIDAVTVPYRGSAPMLTDLLAGRIQVAFDNIAGPIGHIKAGSLHALAVTTTTRSDSLPGVPSVSEFLSGYEAYAVAGFGAPKGTPADIIAKLNAEINAGLADPKLRARLGEMGVSLLAGTPTDFAQLIARETDKWGRLIKSSGIKVG